MKLFKAILMIVGLFFISCWERQEHEINVPETPVYDVTGRVICSITHVPLSNVDVTISGYVKFNDEDSARTFILQDVTDEDGWYHFSDVPGGYQYALWLMIDGYDEMVKKIVTYYQDKIVDDIVLGKLLQFINYVDYEDLVITGIAYHNGYIWIADTLEGRIMQLDGNLAIKRTVNMTLNTPSGLASDGEWFWTSDSIDEIMLQFQVDDVDHPLFNAGHIIYGPNYPAPPNYYDPEMSIDILDLACNSNEFWGCSNQTSNKYFKFDPTDSTSLIYFDSPLSGVKGIYADSATIYLACEYSMDHNLYLIDKNSRELLGYYVIPEDMCTGKIAGYLTKNSNRIWIARKNDVAEYSF